MPRVGRDTREAIGPFEKKLQIAPNGDNPLEIKDLVLLIFNKLSAGEFLKVRLVCKKWKDWTEDLSLWEALFPNRKKAFPKPSQWSIPLYLSIDRQLLVAVKQHAKVVRSQKTKAKLERVTGVFLENIETRVCRITLTSTDGVRAGDPTPLYRRISRKLMQEMIQQNQPDVLEKIGIQISNSLSLWQAQVERISPEQAKRWWASVKHPSPEFKDWRKRSQIEDIFSVGPYIYLLGVEEKNVDYKLWHRFMYGEDGAPTLNQQKDILEAQAIVTDFLLTISGGKGALGDSSSISEFIQRTEKALSSPEIVVNLAHAAVKALVVDPKKPHPGVCEILFNCQVVAPRLIRFIYEALQRHCLSPILQKTLLAWLKNRATLERFLNALIIDGKSIEEGTPSNQTTFEWANKALSAWQSKQILVSSSDMQAFMSRIQTPESSMGKYLQEPFRDAYPSLSALLCSLLLQKNTSNSS